MARNITFSAFLACVSGIALMPTTAHAEADLYFFPKNKWVVEQVSTQNSMPVCSISNQFNNGYIMQVAGTQRGLVNMNIDFRQNAFEANKKYEVQYTIPGQNTALIQTKAYTQSLLVSDLRDMTAFSNSLHKAGTLDVSVSGNQFRLYLTGLESKLAEYQDCIDPKGQFAAAEKNAIQQEKLLSQEPKPSGDIAPLPPIALNEQVDASPEADMPEYKKRPDFNTRDRYTDTMSEKLKEKSADYMPTEENTGAAPIETSEKVAEINKPVIFESESKTVENDSPKAITPPMEDDKYAAAIEDVKNTVDRKGAVYNITKNKEPIVADFTHIDEKSNENTDEELANVPMITPPEMDAQEPASGEILNTHNNDDFMQMRGTISQLENEIGVLTRKNEMLENELKSTLQDSEQERLSVSSQNWNLEKATMKFNEAERQIMRLGRQLQTARAQCEQEKASLETMLFDPKLTSQQQLTKLSSLEAELEQARSDLYRQQRQYEERIRLLEERLSTP